MPTALRRVPLVAGALLVLLAGMWGGLLRMGWEWPAVPVLSIPYHGPLMIGGFLGTLIGLERAVALRRAWTYGAPVAAALGAVCLLAGLPVEAGQWLFLAASAILVVVFVQIIRRQLAAFTVVMALGAVAWLAGNAVWLGWHMVPAAVPWWVAFLVLTIVGERLELSRLLPRSRGKQPTFMVAAGLYLGGTVLMAWRPGLGMAVAGAGLVALAAWLAVYDLARRTIRQSGLPRFAAGCLLSGYLWLAVCGGLAVYFVVRPAVGGGGDWMAVAPMAGLHYDAILHAVLLGFVFAMIFGHAPIIFPAVLGVRMDYRSRFYGHLLLLQLSVLLRIGSDLGGWYEGRQWAGLFNALAITLFLINTVGSVHLRGSVRAPLTTQA